jgi:hypothetical protein
MNKEEDTLLLGPAEAASGLFFLSHRARIP